MNSDVINHIIEAAITAPSGHNTQPWLFDSTKDGILVLPDFSHSLPALDPDNRELYISIGCAVENICVAATQFNVSCKVEIADGGVAVSFDKAECEPLQLAAAIPLRHSNRNIYDDVATLPQQVVADLADCGAQLYMRGSAEFEVIKGSIVVANKTIYGSRHNKKELKDWIRYNSHEAGSRMDGLCYDVLGMPSLPVWISRAATSMALNATVQSRSDVKKFSSSSCAALLSSVNDIGGWVDCGRRVQRLLLRATLHDVACAFMCQPCEVDSVAATLAMDLGLNARPQVLLRLGYAAPPPAYSRRRPLATFKL